MDNRKDKKKSDKHTRRFKIPPLPSSTSLLNNTLQPDVPRDIKLASASLDISPLGMEAPKSDKAKPLTTAKKAGFTAKKNAARRHPSNDIAAVSTNKQPANAKLASKGDVLGAPTLLFSNTGLAAPAAEAPQRNNAEIDHPRPATLSLLAKGSQNPAGQVTLSELPTDSLKQIYDSRMETATNFVNDIVGTALPEQPPTPTSLVSDKSTMSLERRHEFFGLLGKLLSQNDGLLEESEILQAVNAAATTEFTQAQVDLCLVLLTEENKIMRSDGQVYRV